MTHVLKIVGLGGSLAEVSRSRAALRVALDGAAAAGAETTLLDLRELDLPMYNPDDELPSTNTSATSSSNRVDTAGR
jgi:azobenzene reductase